MICIGSNSRGRTSGYFVTRGHGRSRKYRWSENKTKLITEYYMYKSGVSWSKMPGNCEAVGCTNHTLMSGNKPSFHRFPKDPERRKKWTIALKKLNRDGSEWLPSTTARICGEHFINGRRRSCFQLNKLNKIKLIHTA